MGSAGLGDDESSWMKLLDLFCGAGGAGMGYYRAGFEDERKAAMGIDWMGRDSLGLAIPPAYTEWIGRQLRQIL